MPPLTRHHHRSPRGAFSLVELLTVLAICAVLAALSIPAMQMLKTPASVNKSVADLSRTLTLARVYAMANRTHVRVLFTQIPANDKRLVPATAAYLVYSADGTEGGDITKAQEWPALDKPLILDDLLMYNQLQGAAPNNTANDVTPMGDNAQGALAVPLSRELPGQGQVQFTGQIQFTPSGEAKVSLDEPARYIKIALDRPQPGSSSSGARRNPVILRLSGTNGTIKALRAEDIVL